MNQKFSRKELERLECTEEEIKLVMDYQKKLPVIVENDKVEMFCVYARDLYDQLEVGRQFTDWFSRRVKSYKFIENVDFSLVSHFCEERNFAEGGDTRSKNYYITMDMAKQLSMVERTDIGNMARRYYILMEDLVKRNKDWLGTRFAERKNYIPMCEALSDSIYRMCGRRGDDIDFKFEANRLNIIATGEKAQSIRLYFGVDNPSELTRDSLYLDYNEKINFLQEQNKLLLALDLPVEKRINMLIQFFDTKYPEAKPLRYNSNREYLLKARNNMLIELN